MYKIFSFLPFLALIIAMSSCSKDDSLSVEYRYDFCTVVKDTENEIIFVTDDSLQLLPVNNINMSKIKNGERYSVLYNILGLKYNGFYRINVSDIQPVVLKDIADSLNRESDYVEVITSWVGGSYINIKFSFKYYNNNIKHDIWLSDDSLAETPEGKKIIYLDFGHSQNGDAAIKETVGYASFNMESIENLQNADSIILKCRNEIVTGFSRTVYSRDDFTKYLYRL